MSAAASAAPSPNAREDLQGVILQVRYKSSMSDFCSLDLVEEGNRVSRAVGKMPNPIAGERLMLVGSWTPHAGIGRVFAFDEYNVKLPEGRAEQAEYLSRATGIPIEVAGRISEHFGDEVMVVIETSPSRLTEIEGIDGMMAETIQTSWRNAKAADRLTYVLQEHGIDPALIARIKQVVGTGTSHRSNLRENPWLLTIHFKEVSFSKSEAIALRMGANPEQIDRVSAAIMQVLRDDLPNGHTWVGGDMLMAGVSRLLGRHIDERNTDIVSSFQELTNLGKLVRSADNHYFLSEQFDAEGDIAMHCRRLLTGDSSVDFDVPRERLLRIIPGAPGWLVDNIMALGGNKVLLVNSTDHLALRQFLEAAKTLTELLSGLFGVVAASPGAAEDLGASAPIQMLGSLLERHRVGPPARNQTRPINFDVLIVCQAESLGTQDISELLLAVPDRARVIIAGDVNSAPPAGGGQPFKDMWASNLPKLTLPRASITPLTRLRESLIKGETVKLEDLKPSRESALWHVPAKDDEIDSVLKALYEDILPAWFPSPVRLPSDIAVFMAASREDIDRVNAMLAEVGQEDSGAHNAVFYPGAFVLARGSLFQPHIPSGSRLQVSQVDPGKVLLCDRGRKFEIKSGDLRFFSHGLVCPVSISPAYAYETVIFAVPPRYGRYLRREHFYNVARMARRLILVGRLSDFVQASETAIHPRRTGLKAALDNLLAEGAHVSGH